MNSIQLELQTIKRLDTPLGVLGKGWCTPRNCTVRNLWGYFVLCCIVLDQFLNTWPILEKEFATKTWMSSPRNLSNYPHEFYSLRPLPISAQQSTESSLLQFCLKPNFSERFRISNNFPRNTSLSVIQLFSDNQFIQGFLRLINRKPKLRGVLLNRLTGTKFKGQQKIWKKLLSLFLHAKNRWKMHGCDLSNIA